MVAVRGQAQAGGVSLPAGAPCGRRAAALAFMPGYEVTTLCRSIMRTELCQEAPLRDRQCPRNHHAHADKEITRDSTDIATVPPHAKLASPVASRRNHDGDSALGRGNAKIRTEARLAYGDGSVRFPRAMERL